MFASSINYWVQDKANPLATILSAAMLLRYGLGEENAAKRVEAAVKETLNNGFRTGDIYSPGTVRLICYASMNSTMLVFVLLKMSSV